MNAIRLFFERRGPALLNVLLALVLTVGCSQSSAKQADPDTARQTLQTVLQAWKTGQSRDTFVQQSAVHTIDSRWAGGYKLLEYEIASGEEAHGLDLNYRVTLQLADEKGKRLQETVTYRVATSPRLVVIRSEDF